MSTLHLMIGIPGSGKSTYVKELLKTHDYVLVSTDKVRQDNPNLPESEVFPTVYRTMGEALNKGLDVVFDATNITPKVRNRLKDNLKIQILGQRYGTYKNNVVSLYPYTKTTWHRIEMLFTLSFVSR